MVSWEVHIRNRPGPIWGRKRIRWQRQLQGRTSKICRTGTELVRLLLQHPTGGLDLDGDVESLMYPNFHIVGMATTNWTVQNRMEEAEEVTET